MKANGRGQEGTNNSWNPDLEEEDTEENKDIVVNTPPRPMASREVVTAEDLGRSQGDTREGMDRAEAGGPPDRVEPGGPTTPMKRGNTESPGEVLLVLKVSKLQTIGLLHLRIFHPYQPVTEPMRTRYGRVVKKPIRFQD